MGRGGGGVLIANNRVEMKFKKRRKKKEGWTHRYMFEVLRGPEFKEPIILARSIFSATLSGLFRCSHFVCRSYYSFKMFALRNLIVVFDVKEIGRRKKECWPDFAEKCLRHIFRSSDVKVEK